MAQPMGTQGIPVNGFYRKTVAKLFEFRLAANARTLPPMGKAIVGAKQAGPTRITTVIGHSDAHQKQYLCINAGVRTSPFERTAPGQSNLIGYSTSGDCRSARTSPNPLPSPARQRNSRTFRRRSAFVITETDESDIAAPASIGLSNRPKNG